MTLEGVLGPNSRLDEADSMAVEAPQALCASADGRLLYSSGNAVHALTRWGAEAERWAAFDAPVTALAASGTGLVAAGLEGGRLAVLDASGKALSGWAVPAGTKSIVDCAFDGEDEIVVVDNGYAHDEDFMAVATWDEVGRGRVSSLARSGAPRTLAEGLHCPMGLTRDAEGEWLVSLFERAAVVDLAGKVRRWGYPGYPGRLRRTATGYVMACLARRDPLIEFLKTQNDFVAEMKAEIAPRHWISPRARPEFSHDFPIEMGSTRLFGEIKPWAPSFSYGLVIEMDADMMPVASAHSRANGTRHDITDALVWNGELFAVSRASAELLKVGTGRAAA